MSKLADLKSVLDEAQKAHSDAQEALDEAGEAFENAEAALESADLDYQEELDSLNEEED